METALDQYLNVTYHRTANCCPLQVDKNKTESPVTCTPITVE